MKKLIILAAFTLLSSATLIAQNSAVNKAGRFLDRGELDEAKANIDQAVDHEKTKDKGKTWYTKGQVYQAIAQSDNADYQQLDDNALEEAAEAYRKAMELEKENSTYHVFSLQKLNELWGSILNKGAELYDQGAYEEAIVEFNKLKKSFPEDTTGYLYAGISAMQAGDYKLTEQNYTALIDMGYVNYDVYSGLIWIEKTQNDNPEKALKIVEMARKELPENLELMREEINLLLNLERTEQALEKAEAAIEKEPENPSMHYILAYLYDELGKGEQAEASYKDAIEINPQYFDATYNLAILYFNRGVEVLKEANNMDIETYQKKGKEIKAQADQHFETAIPYLEKAHEIKPDDKAVIEILETTYAELGKNQEAEKYKQKLEALGGPEQ